MSDQQLADKLLKPIIRKFKKRSSTFIGNDWGADLAGMQLVSKFNKGYRFLLFATETSSKYAWVIPLKDKKNVLQLLMLFKKSNPKPNKTCLDKDSEFCDRSIKSWLNKKYIEIYSTHSESKSFVAERFINNKIY